MDQQSFNVYPNLIFTTKVCKATFYVEGYVPFKSATIIVLLLDENNRTIETKNYILDETNGFNQWGADDKYLIEFIKKQLSSKTI